VSFSADGTAGELMAKFMYQHQQKQSQIF